MEERQTTSWNLGDLTDQLFSEENKDEGSEFERFGRQHEVEISARNIPLEFDDYEYPDQQQMATCQYPRDFKRFYMNGYTFMFPLSADTLVRTTADYRLYYGRVNRQFNPFAPFDPQNVAIKFYAGPKICDEQLHDLKLAYSNITRKGYLFQRLKLHKMHTLCAFAADFPRPHLKTRIFYIYQNKDWFDFEVDPSMDREAEFNVIVYDRPEQCLFFLQINLIEGKLLGKKKLAIPSLKYAEMLSVESVAYSLKNGQKYVMDIASNNTPVKSKIGNHGWVFALPTCAVFTSTSRQLGFFMRKSKSFHLTDFSQNTYNAVYFAVEAYPFVILRNEFTYFIFRMAPGKPQCVYQTPVKKGPNIILYTTEYLFECKDGFPLRCMPFRPHFQIQSIPTFRKQDLAVQKTLQGSSVLQSLGVNDLVLASNGSIFLVTPDRPPAPCVCFQNGLLTEANPPLLIRLQATHETLLWDGKKFERIEGQQLSLRNLLLIATGALEEGVLNDKNLYIKSLGHNAQGVFRIDDESFAFSQSTEFFSYYYFAALFPQVKYLSAVRNQGLLSFGRGTFFFIEIRTDSIIFSDSGIKNDLQINGLETRSITLPIGCSFRLINPVRGKVVGRIEQAGEPPQYFTFQYLPFIKPLQTALGVHIDQFYYTWPEKSEGIVLLVPLTSIQEGAQNDSIVQLINNYPYFKAKGIKFESLGHRQPEDSFEKDIQNEMGYELMPVESTSPVVESFLEDFKRLSVKLNDCSPDMFFLLYLMEFESLQEMDVFFKTGRLITFFAKWILREKKTNLLTLLKDKIIQIQSLGISLKTFYEAVSYEVEAGFFYSPPEEVEIESQEMDVNQFKKYLKEQSHSAPQSIKIFKSALQFPPSNHLDTLQLAQQLSNTQELGLFEAKLVQIYIQKRWEDSIWFFKLESAFLLTGLLIIFLHSSFYRTPYLIVPLLPIQFWVITIESIEIRNKKWRYLADFWNLFDILRFVFTFIYFGVAIAESSSETLKTVLLVLLSLCQSVKAFQLFSLFKSTRVLLRIVIEIVKDMVPFMLFVFVTTLTVSLLYTSATPQSSLTDRTFSDFLMHVYRLDFGDFSPDDYSPLEIAIFILAVISVPLVFLNMLIAIMGDTFDRVMEDQGRRDYQEMAGLVYRYEAIVDTLCHCKKKKRQPWKHILYTEFVKEEGEEVIEPWQGRIRGIKLDIEKLQRKQEQWEDEMRKWQKKSEEMQRRNQEKQRKSEYENKELGVKLLRKSKAIEKVLEELVQQRQSQEVENA